MAELALTQVMNISVSETPTGIGEYNTSNLALFTAEPRASSFGTSGFKLYRAPSEVEKDFGTESQTFKMANKVFAQKPNILAGGGYLAVIPFILSKQQVLPSAVPASGSFVLSFKGNASAAINYNDSADQVQAKLRALPGLSQVKVTGTVGAGLHISLDGVYGEQPAFVVSADTLQTSGSVAVTLAVSSESAGEAVAAAITRAKGLVQFFGAIFALIFSDADIEALADVIQPLNKIAFVVSNEAASVETGGALDKLRTAKYSQTRGLFYGGLLADALNYAAAYASRALSVNFNGSNTTITMHLKDLVGIQPDATIDETLLAKVKAAGADVYVSLQGTAKVLTSGANTFFDRVYNKLWFTGALQVAGFNYLAKSSTKIPQTEEAMLGFKGALRKVCQRGVDNQYLAPGEWTNPETFGVQEDFLANIRQEGFYIYSQPLAQQAQADREDRKGVLTQIAVKEAGAQHTGDVLVNVNA